MVRISGSTTVWHSRPKSILAAVKGDRAVTEQAGEVGVHPTRSLNGRNNCWKGCQRYPPMGVETTFGS
jgi:hypothetical protein